MGLTALQKIRKNRHKIGFAQVELDVLETSVTNLAAIDIDYTPSGGLSSTNLQTAVDELESEKATGIIASGTYTPVRSGEINLDSNVALTQAQYFRVGNVCCVSGRFKANPTLTATATSFEMTLPIASNIGNEEDLAGTSFCGIITGQGAEITGVPANNTAKVFWMAGDITQQDWSYLFSYKII